MSVTAERPRARRLARALSIPVALALLAGVVGGVGMFTFGYAEGFAYLSDDPTGCANCHVMQEHFDAWQKSSHHDVAVCNDCHLPEGFFGHWITKADNGFFHSLAFTTGDFPDTIRIKPRNSRRTQAACLVCHAETVHQMLPEEPAAPSTSTHEMLSCVHCHAEVGHARR